MASQLRAALDLMQCRADWWQEEHKPGLGTWLTVTICADVQRSIFG